MTADPPPTPVPPAKSSAAGTGRAATSTASFDGVLAFAVVALAVFLASFAAANPDLWQHLAAGRLVAHGKFPFNGGDPFSAAAGAIWINHAWLFDLFLYLLYEPGGMSLVIFKATLVSGLAAVLLAVRRPTGGGLGPAATTTLVLLAASPFFLLRSHVASYLLFAVLLLILHRGNVFGVRGSVFGQIGIPNTEHRTLKTSRWQLPLAVGVLFLLWANLDGGFVFGLLLLAVWLIGAVMQRSIGFGDGESADPPGTLAVALLAAVVGSVINPYHVRGFRPPEELAPLTAPAELWRDEYFRHFFHDQMFVSLFEKAYVQQAGVVAAAAMYVLLAVGLISFAVNTAGWRWQWVLAWAAFAWLGATYARLAPYLAIVAGPAAVLNIQAVLARRQVAAVTTNPRADHLRAMLAAFGRGVLLLGILALLALAWPGWLGPDAREAAPSRRVAWKAVPDPTGRRLAERLNGWYGSGELKEGEARGFHYPPSFSSYCAWFCPAEKGILDSRLTAPPEAIADYLAVLAAVRNLNTVGPDRPDPPDPLLNKVGITHLVVSGTAVMRPPPDYNGLGLNLFLDPDRWPLWAIDGRGVIVGWRNSYPKLRLDPVRLAAGDTVEPVPAPPTLPVVQPETAWDRYVAAPAAVPPETYEAGLWLAYHAAAGARLDLLINTAQFVSGVGRLAPAGLVDPGAQILHPTFMTAAPQQAAPQLRAAWQRRAEGRSADAATLLAVRAARRAIRANPADPEAFERLTMAYAQANLDPSVGPAYHVNDAQQITAARQAVNRLAAATHRPTAVREEFMMQEQLLHLYRRRVIPETRAQPLDLILAAFERVLRLREQLPPPATEAEAQRYQDELKKLQAELTTLQSRVKQNRDNWEAASVNKKPVERADIARRYGLAGEALRVLREADVKDLNADAVILMANLAVLAGEADAARDWLTDLGGPGLERVPPQLRPAVLPLMVQVDAAIGDYRTAVEHADDLLVLMEPSIRSAASTLAAELVLPNDPTFPLTRAVRRPIWDTQRMQVRVLLEQRGDWLALDGTVALEGGEIPLARQRLSEAVGLRYTYGGRRLATRGMDLLGSR